MLVELKDLEKELEKKFSWFEELKRMDSIENYAETKYAKLMVSKDFDDEINYQEVIDSSYEVLFNLQNALDFDSVDDTVKELIVENLKQLNEKLALLDLECDVTFDQIVAEIEEDVEMEDNKQEDVTMDTKTQKENITSVENKQEDLNMNAQENVTMENETTTEGAKEMNITTTGSTTETKNKGGVNMKTNKFKEGDLSMIKDLKEVENAIIKNNKTKEKLKQERMNSFVKEVKEKERLCEEYREWLLNNINTFENVRVLTNFHLGNPDVFGEAFKKVLYIAANGGKKSSTEGFDFLSKQLNSLTVSNYIGKAIEFDENAASEISLPQVGTELIMKDLYIKSLIEKGKKIDCTNAEGMFKETTLQRIIDNKHLLSAQEERTFSPSGKVFDEIVALGTEMGVTVNKNGRYIKKNGNIYEYVRITKGESELWLPLVDFVKVNDIEVIKWGIDIYAGSLTVDYAKETKFLTCHEVLFELFRSFIKNMEHEEEQHAVEILFDSKERQEDNASIFVRVESLDKMFAHYDERKGNFERLTWKEISEVLVEESKEIDDLLRENRMFIDNLRKINTLCGNSHNADQLIFDVLINKKLLINGNENIIKNAHGETLGGGAGNTGLLYRVVNMKSALLLTASDKVSANLFSAIFAVDKASRMNNPSSLFVKKSGFLNIYTCYNDLIEVHCKASSTAFVNSYQYDVTGKVMMKDALKGFKISNELDCYFSTMDRHDYFATITGEEDRWDYLLKNIPEELKASVKEAYIRVKAIKANPETSLEEKLRQIKQVQRSYMDLKFLNEYDFTKLLGKVKKDVKQKVEKLSVDFLKGDMTFIANNDIKFIGNNLSEAENKFINETLVISNKIGHKKEIASGMFLHNQVREQILAGETEFKAVQPSITEEPNIDDLVCGKVVINGYEFECKLKYTSINVHDHKNNYASQGRNCDKEFTSNIQDINSTICYGRALGMKNSNEFKLALAATNRELKKGKLVELNKEELVGLKVQITMNPRSKEYDSYLEELKSLGMEPVTNLEEADIIQNGSLFYANKTLIMDKNFRVLSFIFDETGDKTVLVKREKKYYSKEELKAFYLTEDKVLLKSELDKKISTKAGILPKSAILSMLASKDLASISIAVPGLLDTKENGNRIKGILSELSPIAAIEIDEDKFIIVDKTMKKITRYLPKELTVSFKLINEINGYKKNKRNSEIIDLILEGKISNVEDFFNVFKDSDESYLSVLGFVKTHVSKIKGFDIDHKIATTDPEYFYVIKNEQKAKIVEMTTSLNQLTKFQEEKLFTKNAPKLLSEAKAGFYGTLLAMHCNQWEVRINPNSDGFKQFKLYQGQFVLVGRFPITGERGIGLVLVLDENVPENCIALHPFIIEQLMGDTDGDMAYVVFESSNYCKRFTGLTCNEVEYAKIYEEKGWFKKAYNKKGQFEPMDLTYEGTLERHEEYRNQSLFNPRFVGSITSQCMFYADIIYKFFVEEYKNKPELKDKLKAGLAVYEFYIRVVQKQLSQIPIAAKNTSPEDLEEFAVLWQAFNDGQLTLDELSKFIDVTGWDDQSQVIAGTIAGDYETWLSTQESNNK